MRNAGMLHQHAFLPNRPLSLPHRDLLPPASSLRFIYSLRLIRLYGFTLDGPLFHEVVLQIQTDPEALSESQRDLLRKADALGPFPMLPLDPIPTPLLICLRVLHMTPEEAAAILSDEEALGAVLKGHKLDNRREASVINSLQASTCTGAMELRQ